MKKRSPIVVRSALGGCWIGWLTTGLWAQSPSPYTSMQEREIKALSAEQIDDYESGRGMGLALAAELNGYPGPKHVLELRDELDLTDAQVEGTQEVFDRMRERARDLGSRIVERERDLDRLFASHALDAATLAAHTLEIAELQGRLRAAHLRAHLRMMEILSRDQIRRYTELRGYHGGGHSGHHRGDEHGDPD